MTDEIGTDAHLMKRLLSTTPTPVECLVAAARIEALIAERDAAEAKLAKAVEALELTVRADNLRETYHALPNDRNRIGDKKSRKSIARDAWLRAFRKASSTARTALARVKGVM